MSASPDALNEDFVRSLPDAGLIREQLTRAIAGELSLADRLSAKERDYGGPPPDAPPPRVLWFDDEASGAIVMELRAADRIGLLHRVAATLEGNKLDVRWAKVATLGGTVVDSFCLVPHDGEDLDPARRRTIERAVITAAKG